MWGVQNRKKKHFTYYIMTIYVYLIMYSTQDKRVNKINIINVYLNEYDAFVSCLRYSLVCIFADVVNVVVVAAVVVIIVVMI